VEREDEKGGFGRRIKNSSGPQPRAAAAAVVAAGGGGGGGRYGGLSRGRILINYSRKFPFPLPTRRNWGGRPAATAATATAAAHDAAAAAATVAGGADKPSGYFPENLPSGSEEWGRVEKEKRSQKVRTIQC